MTEQETDPHASTSLAEHESTYVHPESPVATPAEPVAVPEPAAQSGSTPDPADTAAEPVNDDPSRGDRDEQGRFTPKKKYRAKSQDATAADVPRIAELTRRRKEAEDRAAKAEARALELEQQIKAPRVPEPPKEFADAEPKYEDFANEPDQYAAWLRAQAAYDRKKEAAEQQKTTYTAAHEAEMKRRNEQRDAWFKERYTQHGARMEKLFQANPEAEKIIEAANVELNPVMLAALLASDQSDQLALTLAQDPELVDDLHVLTDDKAPSRDLVERVQRRMTRGVKVGTTGSTAPAPVVPALPRPPNPVRTGAMKPADTPPGDDSSLAEHERAYGSGGRRR